MTPEKTDPPTSTSQPHPDKRNRNGRWPKGTTGNPAGRPVGSRNRSTRLLEELLEGQAEALVQKAVQLALKGDPLALRLCLDRLFPAPKERRVELPLPKVTQLEHVTAALSAILAAAAEGQITPGEAAILAQVVETQRRLLEAERVEQARQELVAESHDMEAELEQKLGGLCA